LYKAVLPRGVLRRWSHQLCSSNLILLFNLILGYKSTAVEANGPLATAYKRDAKYSTVLHLLFNDQLLNRYMRWISSRVNSLSQTAARLRLSPLHIMRRRCCVLGEATLSVSIGWLLFPLWILLK
jgi:hypothetical protein